MSHAFLYINDAGITLQKDGKIIYCEPSYAWIGKNEIQLGTNAVGRSRITPQNIENRYWLDLSTTSYMIDHYKHLCSADIVSHEMQIIKSIISKDTSLIIVIPPYLNSQQLSLFLGIANELNIKIIGFLESAVAATRREYETAKLVHIELHLHCLSVSLMNQNGKSSINESFIINDCGQAAFNSCWIKMISRAFIKQCRFDPLHAAESDQQLINNLSLWVAQAVTNDCVHLEIEYGNQSYETDIQSSDFIDAVMPLYKSLFNKLRSIFHAEDIPAIQISNRITKLPELADLLELKLSAAVFGNKEGDTLSGASERFIEKEQQDTALKIIQSLPWDKPSVVVNKVKTKISVNDKPSYILFDNVAYPIGLLPMVIGSGPTQKENFLVVSSNITGISRDHCTVIMKNDRCILNDLSRYGTYLNDQRIEGPSILNTGDKIRIGSPGVEMTLITIGDTFGL